jgi:signal transduction histidine kinase/ActR/RegA family two-component response regulator
MTQLSLSQIEAKILGLLDEAFAIRVNNLKQSIVFTLEALELSKQICNQSLIAKSFSRLAFYYMIQGDYKQSIALANNAEAIYELLDDEVGLADAKYTIASIYYKSDNLQQGLKYLLECLVIFTKHNDYLSKAKAYKSLGVIYEYFGDVDSAREVYKSAIEAAEKIADVNMMTNVYNPLSGLYLNEGKVEEAMNLIQKSIGLKTESEDIRGLAFAYYGRGKVYAKTRDYQLAENDYKKAIDIHIQMGEKLGQGIAFQKLAVLYFEQERFEDSKEFAFKALEFSIIYKSRMVKTKASYLLYEIFKKQQNLQDALTYLEVHHTELQANVHSQTFQIIDSYKMIHNMAAKALEDKLDVEKNEILEKKNKAELLAKAKQDFLSNMSHEIRTPLNAVTTITTLLKERADKEDQQLLESLKFSSNNLMLLINDILDFTKLETDKIQLENRPANIKDLLSNIKNTYESLAKEKGLELTLDVDDKIGEVFEIDEMKLAQILGNLINNAIKFTEKGSVGVAVKYIDSTIDAAILKFNVTDTGIGIPEDFLGEIFDTFTQPKSVTTKKQSGSGLGLAIVKKLTALYGSEVTIQTQIGKGSTFSFELVLKIADKKVVSYQKINLQLNELKVLLVEDNKINMLVATKLLSRWGVLADCAVNGNDALEKAIQKKYDIILMDIHMPELNGYDATKQLRKSNSVNRSTPIYAFTADVVANVQTEYVQYFDGFLRKPIEVDELYATLSSAVSVEIV